MSRGAKGRAQLMEALDKAMREASGLGVVYSQEVAARLGIHSTDLECLDLILLRGPVTAGALVEATGLTSGAITGVIDRLERAGFVRRNRDAGDRRKVLVQALPAVNKVAPKFFGPMQRASRAALASYSEQELALLLDFFHRARDGATKALGELNGLASKNARR